jgi:hypothetical protein
VTTEVDIHFNSSCRTCSSEIVVCIAFTDTIMSGEEDAASPSRLPDTDVDWLRNMEGSELMDFIQDLRLRDPETGASDPADAPPNWFEEAIGARPLWLKETNYQDCQFCMNCMLNVSILASEFEKRDTAQFKYKT